MDAGLSKRNVNENNVTRKALVLKRGGKWTLTGSSNESNRSYGVCTDDRNEDSRKVLNNYLPSIPKHKEQ